jgi:hypothetical protein
MNDKAHVMLQGFGQRYELSEQLVQWLALLSVTLILKF